MFWTEENSELELESAHTVFGFVDFSARIL
jgi:hypothetical protein